MSQYVSMPRELFEELREYALRGQELARRLAEATTFRMSFELDHRTMEPRTTRHIKPRDTSTQTPSDEKIAVGRKKSEASWADVVDKLVPGEEFSISRASDIVLPRVVTKATRPRDSMRIALMNDERFERFDRDGEPWFRRRPEQTEFETE